MNKEQAVLINLNNIEKLKEFAKKVVTFTSDVNIYHDSKSYDAKSIMSIFAIDASKPRYVEIISNNPKEISKFKETMKEFEI